MGRLNSAAMTKPRHVSETAATRLLREHRVAFSEHVYEYVERGGTAESARQLAVSEHVIVKTLVMQDDSGHPMIVLMHGDCTVSTKGLARQLGRKRIEPCRPDVAERHTGYLVGGTSPFGTRRALPVYVERTILKLPQILINGGRRGYLLGIEPAALVDVLAATAVDCALKEG